MACSSGDSGYVDNWQTGKTVTECNLHMLTTEDCSDVIFRVGSEKHVVRAHRYVLVSRSCVFHAMFCGPMAEKGEVTIPDIEPDVFKEFLRYLYSDSTNITADTVTGLLYTSRKYAVDALFDQCTSFLEECLCEENVCQILEECHGYWELDLEQKAMNILTQAGEKVIRSPGFLNLCSSCLGVFLKSGVLKLKEEDIFQCVLSWAKEKCKQEGKPCTHENVRRFLGNMIYEIRFTSLSLDYLVNVVGPSQILTAEERMKIVDRIIQTNIDISPFKSSPRNNNSGDRYQANDKTRHYVNRYTQGWAGTNGWHASQEAISFSSNTNIYLIGCQLYGPCAHVQSPYCYMIILYNGHDQMMFEPILNSNCMLKGLKELNDVMFPAPVPIIAGQIYTVSVELNGVPMNYGKGGRSLVEVDGVRFTFMKSAKSTGSTTVTAGQIPGLMWRPINP